MNNVTLENIEFPVFKLRAYDSIDYTDNIVTIHTYWKSYILDNRNLLGKTLGERRTRIREGNVYPLKKIFKNPRALVLAAGTNDTFVDNSGKLFNYQKTKTCAVLCFEIKSKVVVGGRTILHLYDFPTPFAVPSSSLENTAFVTIVKYGDYFMLYSLEEKFIPPFKKRL